MSFNKKIWSQWEGAFQCLSIRRRGVPLCDWDRPRDCYNYCSRPISSQHECPLHCSRPGLLLAETRRQKWQRLSIVRCHGIICLNFISTVLR